MCDCDRIRAHFQRDDATCCKPCHERGELSTIRSKGLGAMRLCCHTLGVVVDMRGEIDINPEDPPSFMMRAARIF